MDGRLSKREGAEALGRDANTPPNLNRGGRLLRSIRQCGVSRVSGIPQGGLELGRRDPLGEVIGRHLGVRDVLEDHVAGTWQRCAARGQRTA